jgi:hypothetical protein
VEQECRNMYLCSCFLFSDLELFRRNSKLYRFVIINDDMIHAYLGYNIIAIEEPMATESPIKEMSE